MKYDLVNYFDKIEALKGKVNVTIVTAIVQGPEYEKDSKKVTSKIKSAVGMKSEKKKATNSKNVESDVKTRRISM